MAARSNDNGSFSPLVSKIDQIPPPHLCESLLTRPSHVVEESHIGSEIAFFPFSKRGRATANESPPGDEGVRKRLTAEITHHLRFTLARKIRAVTSGAPSE
jgi:hypothetical protein